MKIIDIAIFRDGGTKLIETDEGKYWIPKVFGSGEKPDNGKLFKGHNYFQGHAEQVTDAAEIMALMDLLCYSSEKFFYIQRACR